MSHALRSLPVMLVAGVLLIAGCGEQQDQPPRFNQVLGDSPVGAPFGTGPIDMGITGDQTAYRPAAFEPLEGASAEEEGGGGADAEGPRAAINDLIDSIFEIDVDSILDVFVPEQVAALREDPCMAAIYDTADALETFTTTVREKGTGPEFEASNELSDALPLLADPLKKVFSIEVLDEENAVATLAIAKLEIPDKVSEAFQKAMAQSMAMTAGMTGAGGTPPGATPAGAAAPDPNAEPKAPATPPSGMSPDAFLAMAGDTEIRLPMKKVDDEWRLVLPFSVTEDQATLIADGLGIVNKTLDGVTAQVDAAETLDMQTYTRILMQAEGSAAPQLLGWFARAQIEFSSAMEAAGKAPVETGDEGAGQAPKKPDDSAKPEEPSKPEEPNNP